MSLVQKITRNFPIAGIQSLTTIDFPGKIAGVLFTRGCPWRCRYCHNSSLRDSDGEDLLSQHDIEEFLRSHKEFLDGIVISGGEPTLHSSLPDFLAWIRDFGYSDVVLCSNSEYFLSISSWSQIGQYFTSPCIYPCFGQIEKT